MRPKNLYERRRRDKMIRQMKETKIFREKSHPGKEYKREKVTVKDVEDYYDPQGGPD